MSAPFLQRLSMREYLKEVEVQAKEMQRALQVVHGDARIRMSFSGTAEEQRAQFEAFLLALATEAQIRINGKRDIPELALQFGRHLAYEEHKKRKSLR